MITSGERFVTADETLIMSPDSSWRFLGPSEV